MIELDGSQGEGGGQILRSALTLSILTGQPFRLRQIRAGRPRPGLQAQHLMCVRAAREICSASVTGESLGSGTLTFLPGAVRAGGYHFPIGTAGATSLVLHTIALPLLLRTSEASEVTLEGGTHVPFSPPHEFLRHTWCGYVARLGLPVELHMDRYGFYPRGGGRIRAGFAPAAPVASADLDGSASNAPLRVRVATAGVPARAAERLAERLTQRLRNGGFEGVPEVVDWPGQGALYLEVGLDRGGIDTRLGRAVTRRDEPERAADELADEAIALARAPRGVDEYSADQLLLPLCLLPGGSRVQVATASSHFLTNLEIVRAFIRRSISFSSASGIVEIAPEL